MVIYHGNGNTTDYHLPYHSFLPATSFTTNYHYHTRSGNTTVNTSITTVALTHEERALTSQARWFIYSKMHVSKSEFESDEFREMLREQAGGLGVYLTCDGAFVAWADWHSIGRVIL
jgi:hypothetical protein